MLDAQLAELRSDLHTLKNIFEDHQREDNDPFKEYSAAIEGAVAKVTCFFAFTLAGGPPQEKPPQG
jgi:hypothetical protein